MGDRANFGFRQNNTAPVIILYAHWGGGPDMLNRLAIALKAARPRWHDPGYATRIAISQLIGEYWNQELSYGLFVDKIRDNEYPIPVVSWEEAVVSVYPFSYSMDYDFYNDEPIQMESLKSFVEKFTGD